MRARLIYNPASGRCLARSKIGAILERLARHGIAAEACATGGPGQATSLAREAKQAGADLVIAYGGDGTINEVICGIARSEIPLGIIPGGTANVLAKELGIPRDAEAAAEAIASGLPRRINIGLAGERYFHSMAGVGVDASIVKNLNLKLKDALGIGAYWIEGLKHFFTYKLPPFTISKDGVEHRATFAIIGNARNYGGNFVLTPYADLSEALFDVCAFTTSSKARYAMFIPLGFFGAHVRCRDVLYFKAESLAAESEEEVYVQVDGELAGKLPMEFTVVPEGLTVIVPKT